MANAKSNAVEKEKEAMVESAKETTTSKQATKKAPKVISLDTSIEEVLECIESGVQVYFDHKKFLELPDDVVERMPHMQAQAYATAQHAHKTLSGEGMSNYEKRQKDWKSMKLNMIGGNSLDKLKVLAEKEADMKPNNVGRWLTPYDYRNWGEHEGYSPVRSKESGKMLVIGPEDAPEIMLCQVPRQRIEEHRRARSELSKSKVGKSKEDFVGRTEELNRAANVRKDKAMKVVDYGNMD